MYASLIRSANAAGLKVPESVFGCFRRHDLGLPDEFLDALRAGRQSTQKIPEAYRNGTRKGPDTVHEGDSMVPDGTGKEPE
jgi:hypothetical protein